MGQSIARHKRTKPDVERAGSHPKFLRRALLWAFNFKHPLET